MLVGVVGGVHDGETYEVLEPLPPTFHLPVFEQLPPERPGDKDHTAVTVDTYRLAHRLGDFKPFYVEIGAFTRWLDLAHAFRDL
jgi:hypothetical protein